MMFFDWIIAFFPRPSRLGLSSFFPKGLSKIEDATTLAFSPTRNGVPSREFDSFSSSFFISLFLLSGVANASSRFLSSFSLQNSSFTDDATINCIGSFMLIGLAPKRRLRQSRSSSASWLSEMMASFGMEE